MAAYENGSVMARSATAAMAVKAINISEIIAKKAAMAAISAGVVNGAALAKMKKISGNEESWRRKGENNQHRKSKEIEEKQWRSGVINISEIPAYSIKAAAASAAAAWRQQSENQSVMAISAMAAKKNKRHGESKIS